VATDQVIAAKAQGQIAARQAIPIADVIRATDFALARSSAVTFIEINNLTSNG
jgi:nitrous oxide reductase accessory protein NosL